MLWESEIPETKIGPTNCRPSGQNCNLEVKGIHNHLQESNMLCGTCIAGLKPVAAHAHARAQSHSTAGPSGRCPLSAFTCSRSTPCGGVRHHIVQCSAEQTPTSQKKVHHLAVCDWRTSTNIKQLHFESKNNITCNMLNPTVGRKVYWMKCILFTVLCEAPGLAEFLCWTRESRNLTFLSFWTILFSTSFLYVSFTKMLWLLLLYSSAD